MDLLKIVRRTNLSMRLRAPPPPAPRAPRGCANALPASRQRASHLLPADRERVPGQNGPAFGCSKSADACRNARAELRARRALVPSKLMSIVSLRLMQRYFSDELTEVNTVFRLVPSPLTAAMIARAMPAAMRPYSMAVAARSSRRKQEKSGAMDNSGVSNGPEYASPA